MEPIDPIATDRIELTTDWEPTPENLQAIHDLAITGATEQAIASIALKVTDQAYFNLREQYPEINETITTARRQGEAIAAIEYFNEMCRRDAKNRVATLQFYLKNRANWQEAVGSPLPPLLPHKKDLKQLSTSELNVLLADSIRTITEPEDED